MTQHLNSHAVILCYNALIVHHKNTAHKRRIAISACQLRAERKPYLADVLWLRVRVGGVGGESALRVVRRDREKGHKDAPAWVVRASVQIARRSTRLNKLLLHEGR